MSSLIPLTTLNCLNFPNPLKERFMIPVGLTIIFYIIDLNIIL